jgi:hypothetical protein
MAKVWVLDTETKGTGAEMVPLEKVQRKPEAKPRRVRRKPKPRTPKPPPPREAPRFKLVDAMTRQVLAEDVDTEGAVALLEGTRSVVDVGIYAREGMRWEKLSYADKKKLWALRGRTPRS